MRVKMFIAGCIAFHCVGVVGDLVYAISLEWFAKPKRFASWNNLAEVEHECG
jgi:hypothetical protein